MNITEIVWPPFSDFLSGNVPFAKIGELIWSILVSIFSHENFTAVWSLVSPYIEAAGAVIPAVLIALSLFEIFFGKKLIGLQKFIACLALGFFAGVSLLQPLLTTVGVVIPAIAVGVITGIIAALLSKFIYIVVYVAAFGYSAYLISMGGQLMPDPLVAFVKGNMIIGLVSVALAILLSLVFRGFIERAGTAVIGGFCLVGSINLLLSVFGAPEVSVILMAVIVSVASLLGIGAQLGSAKRGKKKVKKEKTVKVKTKEKA